MIISYFSKASTALSTLRLAPVAASFAVLAAGTAHAADYLPPSRYAEQRHYPAQNPRPQYAVKNPVQYGQPQQYAFLGINQQQQQQAVGAIKPGDADKTAGAESEDDFKGPPKKHGWNYEAGAIAMYGPAYQGSDKYQAMALPNLSVDYEDGLFFANFFDGIGSYPIQGENYKLGAAMGFAFGRDEKDDRKNLRGMGDIDMSPTANLMGEYGFGPIQVSGKLTQGNDDYGMTAEAAIGTMFPATDNLMIMAKVGTVWANEDHMNSYFGVSSAQSLRSGYGSYQAESGIKSVGIDIGGFYALSDNIDLMVNISANQLVGDAADSPLAKEDFQPSVFTAISYKF